MCGILGIIGINSNARKLTHLEFNEMDTAIRRQHHRGPDDSGVHVFSFDSSVNITKPFYDDSCMIDGCVGFNRLSIKDLSLDGHQPMTAQNGKVILVFNGEIYNDKDLKADLLDKGYCFKSSTDSEVILNLYLEYGFEKMIALLNGMFAIAIVDLRVKRIYLARDRFGIKPLYYTFVNERIIFGSEIKGILAFHDVERTLDVDEYNNRLVFSRASNAVLLKNVFLLKPGEWLSIEYNESIKKNSYFSLNDYYVDNSISYAEALERLEEILSEAIDRQMISDVNVGCQLSGGVDSSIISYIASHRRTDKLCGAFSVIGTSDDEEEYIDEVARKTQLTVWKTSLTEDYFIKNFEKMIWHNDAPVYQPHFICFYKLAEFASAKVSVLLSGEGADEIAGGYSRFAAGYLFPFISGLNLTDEARIKSYDTYARYAVMSDQTSMNLNGWKGYEEELQKQMNVFNGFTGSNLKKHLKYEISERLPDGLMRQDKMTMAHSIENRVPFLDNEVVDFIMKLPEEYLVRFVNNSPALLGKNPIEWMQGKVILKDLGLKWFGNSFTYRRKQIMVFDKKKMLLSEKFKEYFYDCILPGVKNRGISNFEYVKKSYENINKLTDFELTLLWRHISAETWCKLFV